MPAAEAYDCIEELDEDEAADLTDRSEVFVAWLSGLPVEPPDSEAAAVSDANGCADTVSPSVGAALGPLQSELGAVPSPVDPNSQR